MADSTKLNKAGLNKVWLKVMELIQSLTGNVDRTKGTLQEQIDVKATSEDYGRVKVTNSSAVTDSTGLALAATEKNASIDGTLAKQINELNSNLIRENEVFSTRVIFSNNNEYTCYRCSTIPCIIFPNYTVEITKAQYADDENNIIALSDYNIDTINPYGFSLYTYNVIPGRQVYLEFKLVKNA